MNLYAFKMTALAGSLFLLFGCSTSSNNTPVVSNQLYTQTNQTINTVAHMVRNSDGTLSVKEYVQTGGQGNNVGPDALVSDNSIIVSSDKSTLFVVNAASNSVSSFAISSSTGGLTLLSNKASTIGTTPTSLAFANNVLYVMYLGTQNIEAFAVTGGNIGSSLGAVSIGLSAGNKPTSIVLSPSNNFIVASSKDNSSIFSFPVQSNGSLGAGITNTLNNPGVTTTSFAGIFNSLGVFFNIDPVNKAAQSFSFSNGTLTPLATEVTGIVATPCWSAVTPNGNYLYTGNAGGSISLYSISSAGALHLVTNSATSGETHGVAGDLWVSPDGAYLYAAYLAEGVVESYSINGTTGAITFLNTVNIESTVSMQGLTGV